MAQSEIVPRSSCCCICSGSAAKSILKVEPSPKTDADPTLPLFLLFLQEIISGRDRLSHRNPGVRGTQRGTKQRQATPRST